MNKFIITGRLTRNPELRYTNNNIAITELNLAINNKKDDTTFLMIKVFNKTAETCNEYLNKGDLIAVEGNIKNNNYEDEAGKMHYRTDFIGNKVEFLSTKKKDEIKEEKQDRNSIFEEFGDSIKTESNIGEQIEITSEDLPF